MRFPFLFLNVIHICASLKTSIAIILLFIPVYVQAQDEFHRVEIGFNFGRFPELHNRMDDAGFLNLLTRIDSLGIKDLRIYEVYNACIVKDQTDSLEKLNTEIIDALNNIKQQLPEMQFLISISNLPVNLNFTNNGCKSRIQPDCNYQLTIDSIISRLNVDIIQETGLQKEFDYRKYILPRNKPPRYRHSNRFAPDYFIDFCNVDYDRYRHAAQITDLVSRNTEFITLEIGNEPDAPIYYWGTPNQFKGVADLVLERIEEHVEVMVGGYTKQIFLQDRFIPIKQAYLNQLKQYPYHQNNTTLSWHLYPNGDVGVFDRLSEIIEEQGLSTIVRGSAITEFNLYSNPNSSRLKKVNSQDFMYIFCHLLKFVHHHEIKKVYLHKLLDFYDNHNTLGFFDAKYNPKPSFTYLMSVYHVIRDGYRIEELDNNGDSIYFDIVGRDKSIRVSVNNAPHPLGEEVMKDASVYIFNP